MGAIISHSSKQEIIAENDYTYQDILKLLKSNDVSQFQAMIFIDFSLSNYFQNQNQHVIASSLTPAYSSEQLNYNPYFNALLSLATVIDRFDDDQVFPIYRFGCTESRHLKCVPLLSPYVESPEFKSFGQVIAAYLQASQIFNPSGPTTLGQCIDESINYSKKLQNSQQIISVILTNGGSCCPQYDMAKLIEASSYPISFVVIGMDQATESRCQNSRFRTEQLLDNILGRKFDNLNFLDYSSVMASQDAKCNQQDSILQARQNLCARVFQEIPAQAAKMRGLNLVGGFGKRREIQLTEAVKLSRQGGTVPIVSMAEIHRQISEQVQVVQEVIERSMQLSPSQLIEYQEDFHQLLFSPELQKRILLKRVGSVTSEVQYSNINPPVVKEKIQDSEVQIDKCELDNVAGITNIFPAQ